MTGFLPPKELLSDLWCQWLLILFCSFKLTLIFHAGDSDTEQSIYLTPFIIGLPCAHTSPLAGVYGINAQCHTNVCIGALQVSFPTIGLVFRPQVPPVSSTPLRCRFFFLLPVVETDLGISIWDFVSSRLLFSFICPDCSLSWHSVSMTCKTMHSGVSHQQINSRNRIDCDDFDSVPIFTKLLLRHFCQSIQFFLCSLL